MTKDKNNPLESGAWHGDLPVTSRYTFGVAGERFYRAIKEEGKLFGTRCAKCERTYLPATLFCERCMQELDSWVDVGTAGEVHTFTLLHQDLNGSHQEDPEIIAFIRLGDGGLVHRIKEVDKDQVAIGMQVEAVFKDKKERIGSIEDISHFRPTG